MKHLKTKKIRRGYIVVNTKTGIHAHFKSKYGCYCIKVFIREVIVPDNPYLQESYRRLTAQEKRVWDIKDLYNHIKNIEQ